MSFDEAWLSYLDQFVAWKGADAAALEGELVRMAAAMQASMLRKCRGDPDSERCRASSDLQVGRGAGPRERPWAWACPGQPRVVKESCSS